MGNHKVIPETWRGTGSAAPLARSMRNLGKVINNPFGFNGIYAYVRGGRLVIEGTPQSSMDFSQFCFGFKIDGQTVTVSAGEVQWGESVFGIGITDLSITSNLQYIGIEATYEGATLIGPDSNLSAFRSTKVVRRTWLFQFNWTPAASESESPTVTLRRIGKPLGNWEINSEFSPE